MQDSLQKNLDETDKINVVFTKCKNCGGNMGFDPVSQQLKCIQCGTIETFDKNNSVLELDVKDVFLKGENWNESSHVYRCENCGAVVVLNSNEIATFCPYCSTSLVVEVDELAGLKPNAVYPFTISKSEGILKVLKWAKNKWFSPSKFKKNIKIEDLIGVYEPCYTFDSQTFSSYFGRIGKYHTREVGSGKNRRTERYIVWRRISGNFTYNFDDVFVLCGNEENQKDLYKLGGYDYSTIQTYSADYLKGYMARRSEKTLQDGWKEAKNVIDSRLKKLILSRYNYDVVDYLNVSTSHSDVSYKYVLLPVYRMNFNYKNKQYKVSLNGNSGKISGKAPLSLFKILLTVLLPLGFIVAISLLLNLFS